MIISKYFPRVNNNYNNIFYFLRERGICIAAMTSVW